jgi:hypothetical protein
MKQTLIIFGLLLMSSIAPAALAASSSTAAISTSPQTVEETVREYFADIPVMIEVARCESKFRQFTDSGNVLRGGSGGQMVGVYQFFDRYHESLAYDLGFDIETLEGNLAYARHVYEIEGTDPWNSARNCWEQPDQIVQVTANQSDEVLRQKIALLEQIITLLQQLLLVQGGIR